LLAIGLVIDRTDSAALRYWGVLPVLI